MKRRRIPVALLVVWFLCLGLSRADERWNALALRGFVGGVGNGGRIDGRDGYDAAEIGGEMERGVGLTVVLSERTDLDFDLSKTASSGSQYAADGSDRIDIELELLKLAITSKHRFLSPEGLCRPWWGGGADVGVLQSNDREVVTVTGGPFAKDALHRVSNVFGVHGGGGVDLYPLRQSALAVTLEARYSFYVTSGPFSGDVNGFSFFLGLRWDFWQCGMR